MRQIFLFELETDLHIVPNSMLTIYTSHSAYAATETELLVDKIDGFLPPNFL